MGKKKVGKSLQTEAYEKLEEMIVTQALAPASTVTEQYLSELIGIGRTPIREALQRLAREGLVLIRPRAAILILEMSLDRQLQLLEARGAIQQLTIRLAANRANVEERSKMLILAAAIDDAAKIGDSALYLHVARDVHNLLCKASHNEFLSDCLSSLYSLSRQFYFKHIHKVDLHQAATTLSDILRAVAALDEKAAVKASDRMIKYLLQYTADLKA